MPIRLSGCSTSSFEVDNPNTLPPSTRRYSSSNCCLCAASALRMASRSMWAEFVDSVAPDFVERSLTIRDNNAEILGAELHVAHLALLIGMTASCGDS